MGTSLNTYVHPWKKQNIYFVGHDDFFSCISIYVIMEHASFDTPAWCVNCTTVRYFSNVGFIIFLLSFLFVK